jgi:hypothetical protein
MASSCRKRVRHRRMAAIAAVVTFTSPALVSAVPAWTQAPSSSSSAEASEMMGADSEVSPRLHGCLLDNGVFTIIEGPGTVSATVALDLNYRSQIGGGSPNGVDFWVGSATGSLA